MLKKRLRFEVVGRNECTRLLLVDNSKGHLFKKLVLKTEKPLNMSVFIPIYIIYTSSFSKLIN
jgi:hypothetical protein